MPGAPAGLEAEGSGGGGAGDETQVADTVVTVISCLRCLPDPPSNRGFDFIFHALSSPSELLLITVTGLLHIV